MNRSYFKKVLFSMCFLLAIPALAFADGQEKMIQFDVMPESSPLQNEQIKSYFDLTVKPDQTLTVYMDVKNLKTEPMNLHIDTTNALTTKNGGIYYTTNSSDEYTKFTDQTFAIKNSIQVDKMITIQPNEIKKIPITIKTPHNKTGIYIGGLIFYTDDVNVQKNNNGSNVSFNLKNEYKYAMAIELNMPEKDKTGIQFGKTTVQFYPSGAQMFIEMKNPYASILETGKTTYQVFDSQNKKVFGGILDELKMAPKTLIEYPIFWGGKEIKSGTYHIEVDTSVNGKTVHYTDQFQLKNKQVNKYVNKVDKTDKSVIIKEDTPWWIWILFGSMVIVAFIFGIFFRRKK